MINRANHISHHIINRTNHIGRKADHIIKTAYRNANRDYFINKDHIVNSTD